MVKQKELFIIFKGISNNKNCLRLESAPARNLTRNLVIENTPVLVLSNIWRLEQDRNTTFGVDVSNKKLLDGVKCQVHSFYCF